ncbi:adenine deaminase [Terrilactibacillus laevilacticus]|uniref:Adenine deaminase n=1 Tax=Terrilactibacillus laevilacticus TaxID=1380157 RepID=A0ABW5PRK0_9BACI|nr:adenine deaminase [Terrilactibacillus laevilacticus]
MDKNLYISAAKGDITIDLAIENIKLVNVFSGEIYPANIGIYQDKIVHVDHTGKEDLKAKEVVDGKGKYAIPGLIDTHLHIESSMITPGAYAEAILPHGTTTIVTDPHEIGNVLGEKGIEFMIEASKDLDLRILTFLPSCVPSAPGVETTGADFTPDVVQKLIQWENIAGLAEVMNYVGVIEQDDRMLKIVEAAKKTGKTIQGHAPFVMGRDLSAYIVAGIDSDHECRTTEEAIERIRSGMYVEIRESSFSMNVNDLAKAINDKDYVPNVTLCSDDVKASDLIRRGTISHVIRQLIKEGIDPVNAIRFGTINAAQRLSRSDLGAISPGRIADIVLLDDLESMMISDVFTSGKHIVEKGKLQVEQTKIEPPQEFLQTVNIPEISEKDFSIKVNDPAAKEIKINVIDYSNNITNFIKVSVPVENGEVSLEQDKGTKDPLIYIGVFHRHGRNNNQAIGVLSGFGIIGGAIATTIAHDCHNLVVLGSNKKDMVIAAKRIKELNGGMVAVEKGKIIAELPLPLAGLMSLESAYDLTPKIDLFERTLNETIMPDNNPISRLIPITLAVIPNARMTDIGLVDVNVQEFVPLLVE